MPKIFISYGRDQSHGQNLATEAQQQLQAAGFDVFRDVIGLKPGDVWYSKLEFELDSSDLVVLVVSEKIRHSEWVHNEISMAKEIGLPIIPVIAEQVRMPLWLRHLQTLDFSECADWQQLLSAIETHVGIDKDSLDLNPVALPQAAKVSAKMRQDEAEIIDFSGELENDEDAALKPVALPSVRASNFKKTKTSRANEIGKDQYGQYADLKINNVTQRFRLINPGTFLMGSPESEKGRYDDETQHHATLSKPFWLADTACTQALWLAVMGNNPSRFTDNKNNPVDNVSWNDVQEFIQALSLLKPDVTVQLPTEAQWEYACRVGTTTPFSFGENMTSEQVNYDGDFPYKKGFFQKKDLNRGKTLAVQSLPANPWGLYEMHGNVMEWCRDAYSGLSSEACTDPYNQSGDYRVLRGGSWANDGRDCRSACRGNGKPTERYGNFGFRLSWSTERSGGH